MKVKETGHVDAEGKPLPDLEYEIDCIAPEEGERRTKRLAEIEAEVERLKDSDKKQDMDRCDVLVEEYRDPANNYVVDSLYHDRSNGNLHPHELRLDKARIGRLSKKKGKSQDEIESLLSLLTKHAPLGD